MRYRDGPALGRNRWIGYAALASLWAISPAEAADLTGRWETGYGSLFLSARSDGSISGYYDQPSKRLVGQMQGRRLRGYFYHLDDDPICGPPPSDAPAAVRESGSAYWGQIDFLFNGAGTRFTGWWQYCDALPVSDWNGAKTCEAQVDPGGRWATDYGGMEFPGHATGTVRATYDNGHNGRVVGDVSDQQLVGVWVNDGASCTIEVNGESVPDERDGAGDWGDVEFQFDDGFYHFNGRYAYCSREAGEDWSSSWAGTRTCEEQPGDYPVRVDVEEVTIVSVDVPDEPVEAVDVGDAFQVRVKYSGAPTPEEHEPVEVTILGVEHVVAADIETADPTTFLTAPLRVPGGDDSPTEGPEL